MSKKPTLDVVADMASSDSLSFAGLVCIQDHNSTWQSKNLFATPLEEEEKQETEFEFSRANAGSINEGPENKFSSVTSNTNQHRATKKLGSKGLKSPVHSNCRKSDSNQSNLRSSSRKNAKEVKRANEKRKAKQSSSRGLFLSVITPCRNCRATEPSSVKQPALK